MEKVVESFIQLVKTFQAAPLSFIIVVLIVALVYISYSQTEYIISLIPDPEKENAQFQASLQRDLIINQSLMVTLESYKANNIVISQFHNGQYDLTRLPFTKISTTYAVGTFPMNSDNLYGERPLSTMNRVMLQMWKDKENPECVASATRNLEDPSFRTRVEAQGLQFISLCPLTNILNYPIGYIAVGYDFIPPPEEVEVLKQYQKTMTARIAGYLQEGVVDGRD